MADWGSIPDWITAAGALLALIFARSAARAAHGTNRQQAGQLRLLELSDAKRAREERRWQAANLSFWVSLVADESYRPAVKFINSNKVPLYQLTMYCVTPAGVARATMNVASPQIEARTLRRYTAQLRELAAGIANPIAAMDRWEFRIAGTFRDASGQWWHRRADGGLEECENAEDATRRCRADLQANS